MRPGTGTGPHRPGRGWTLCCCHPSFRCRRQGLSWTRPRRLRRSRHPDPPGQHRPARGSARAQPQQTSMTMALLRRRCHCLRCWPWCWCRWLVLHGPEGLQLPTGRTGTGSLTLPWLHAGLVGGRRLYRDQVNGMREGPTVVIVYWVGWRRPRGREPCLTLPGSPSRLRAVTARHRCRERPGGQTCTWVQCWLQREQRASIQQRTTIVH